MSENSKKTKPSYNEAVIRILHERHGYTKHYIRMSINGTRKGINPDRLKKEYHQMDRASQEAINQVAQNQNLK